MALETRHTEKSILFQLLKAQKENRPIEDVIAYLSTTMEQDDVKVVKQGFAEWLKGKEGNKERQD